ncbi:MAG: 3-hydroxybutyryl-CoA dehydrogenase, partial [Planctomycetota bacterium]
MAVPDAGSAADRDELSLDAPVAVVGAGTMGNGIAQVFAQAGYGVTLIDVAEPQLERARATIEKNLGRLAKKGKIDPAEIPAVLERIALRTELEAAANAALVVEAIVEAPGPKRELFERLDAITPPSTILASNTSSISITTLAAATGRADRVIGMHFMNPVPVMQLVEVIRGEDTSDETTRIVVGTCRVLGKTPVEVNDYPGFVSNRILMPMLNEAFYCVMEGVAEREAI